MVGGRMVGMTLGCQVALGWALRSGRWMVGGGMVRDGRWWLGGPCVLGRGRDGASGLGVLGGAVDGEWWVVGGGGGCR